MHHFLGIYDQIRVIMCEHTFKKQNRNKVVLVFENHKSIFFSKSLLIIVHKLNSSGSLANSTGEEESCSS